MDEVVLNVEFKDYSPPSPFLAFLVTEDKVNAMCDAEIIWNHTIVRGHVQVWCGAGNAGKTTIAMLAAAEIAKTGCEVLYFQEDAGKSDLPALHEHSIEHGYQLLNTALAQQSAEDIVRILEDLAKSGNDLSGQVYFFDTLKKFCDLMVKGGVRRFFTLMRSLSTLGATIVLLGHTNKHLMDGKPVFEGVGDIRNDTDELFYVTRTEKDDNGMCVVGMEPDKQRALVKETSYEMNTLTREIKPVEMQRSVAEIRHIQNSFRQNQDVIDCVNAYLEQHQVENLTALADFVNKSCERGDRAIGRNKAMKIIKTHSSPHDDELALWLRTKGFANNAVRISKKPSRKTECAPENQ